MKKLLVVALSVMMVLSFAAFAMADANTTLVGNVNAEYNTIDAINNGYGDVWAEFDLTKDFTEGWTGGLKFRVKPKDSNTGMEGDGFIKYTADIWNLNLATGGSFGVGQDLNIPNASKTITYTKGPLAGTTVTYLEGKPAGPNVAVNLTPMEGFTGTLWITDAGTVTKQTYNYGVKAVYDLNGLKVGAGYATETWGTTNTNGDYSQMGVFGSYKMLEDALDVGAEYQSRSVVGIVDPAVGMKVYAKYSKDALSAGLSYMTRTANFFTKDDKTLEMFSLADRFQDLHFNMPFYGQNELLVDEKGTRYLLSANASYKITEAITAGLNVDMTDAKYSGTRADGTAATDVSTGYKIYVSDQIVPDLTLEAGYQAFLDSKVYVKLSAKIN